jgi:malonate decarboxylase alpha subunit
MSDTSPRGADRASRLARAAALSGTSGKVCPAVRDHRSTPTEFVIDAY